MIELKIFIWLFCFFVVAVIQTAAREAGVILGAIPAMLLFGLAWWSAKKLCARWEQRQAEKAVSPSYESPAPDSLPIEPPPTSTAPSSPTPTTPKVRFCKLCGDPIDPATRKCTGCRKQYFRLPVIRKHHMFIAASVLACITVTFFIFNLVSQRNTAVAQIDKLNAQISELEATVAAQDNVISIFKLNESNYQSKLTQINERCNMLREENTTYKKYLKYCEYYCAYIVPNGQIYHRLDCPYAEAAENLVILYIDFLESRGCKPCSHCYG